jgi:hypothetical protein
MFCVEPAPPTRTCLERNLEPWSSRRGHRITTLSCALGAADGDTTIEFLPGLPANSSIHPDDKREQLDTVVERFTIPDLWRLNRYRPFAAIALVLLTLVVYPFRRAFYRRILRRGTDGASRFPCRVRPLRSVLEECSLSHVDLLKVDAEGAELEVLDGLGQAGLAIVRQLAIEIEPYHRGHVPELVQRLARAGFGRVSFESPTGQDDVLGDPYPCMLYAIRG